MGQQQQSLELTRDNGDYNFDSAANQARIAWQDDLDHNLNQTILAQATGQGDLGGGLSVPGIEGPIGADTAQALGKDGKPKELSPALQQSRDALLEFKDAPNKGEAIWNLRPKFEGAITLADTTATQTITDVTAELKQLKPDMDKVQAALKPSMDAFGAEFAKVKPEEQPAVAAFLDMYSKLKPDDPKRAEMAEALDGRYPGLIKAVNDIEQAQKDNEPIIKPLREKLEGISGRLASAMSDRVSTRVAYATALMAGGDEAKAMEVYEDAQRVANGMEPVSPEERRERDKKRWGIREA
jgi:hypothetical protein